MDVHKPLGYARSWADDALEALQHAPKPKETVDLIVKNLWPRQTLDDFRVLILSDPMYLTDAQRVMLKK